MSEGKNRFFLRIINLFPVKDLNQFIDQASDGDEILKQINYNVWRADESGVVVVGGGIFANCLPFGN